MGLFDRVRKKSLTESTAPEVPLGQTCYDIAYFILPQYVFERLDELTGMCLEPPAMAGPFFYVMACKARNVEPDMDSAVEFKWQHGLFDASREYFALIYPTPPPVELGDSDPIAMLKSGNKLVLAPHFSVILCSESGDAEYFILGQAPIGGGTTVREILEEGMNCNLGPGPEPTLEGFFAAIRERQSEREA